MAHQGRRRGGEEGGGRVVRRRVEGGEGEGKVEERESGVAWGRYNILRSVCTAG